MKGPVFEKGRGRYFVKSQILSRMVSTRVAGHLQHFRILHLHCLKIHGTYSPSMTVLVRVLIAILGHLWGYSSVISKRHQCKSDAHIGSASRLSSATAHLHNPNQSSVGVLASQPGSRLPPPPHNEGARDVATRNIE